MKKILLSLSLILLTSLSGFSQKLTWQETAEILFDVLAESLDDTEAGLQSVGGGSVDLYGVEGENALEYLVLVNRPSLVTSLTNAELIKRKDGLAEALLQQLITYYDESQVNTILSSMSAADGIINIVYACEKGSNPVAKEIVLTADDLKRMYKSMETKLAASPEGHTYVARVNGMTITLKFRDSSVNAIYNDGYRESQYTYSWYKEGMYVIMSDEDGAPLEISANAQTLTDTSNGVVFRLKK